MIALYAYIVYCRCAERARRASVYARARCDERLRGAEASACAQCYDDDAPPHAPLLLERHVAAMLTVLRHAYVTRDYGVELSRVAREMLADITMLRAYAVRKSRDAPDTLPRVCAAMDYVMSATRHHTLSVLCQIRHATTARRAYDA